MQPLDESTLLRSSDPLLIVTAPTTHDALLGFSILLNRYVLGLETHFTFSLSINSRRIAELLNLYKASVLIGLENNVPRLSASDSSLIIYITDISPRFKIEAPSNVKLHDWTQLQYLGGIGDKVATLALIGKTLDDDSPYAALTRFQKIDKNLTRSNVPVAFSISSNEPGLSLWPLIMNEVNASGQSMEVLRVLLSRLPNEFTSTYMDYILVPSMWLGNINLAKLYLLVEAHMALNSNDTEEGKMPRLPLLLLMNAWRSPSLLDDELNRIAKPYIDLVKSTISKMLSALSRSRQYEFMLSDNLVLIHRICQILSYLDSRYVVKLVHRASAAKMICVPGNATPPSGDIAFYKGNRYLRIVEQNTT